MLPLVVESIRSVGINFPIWVAPCYKSPPETVQPLTPAIKWLTNEVVETTLQAMLSTGSQRVLKIDSDMLFLKRPSWLDSDSELCGYEGAMGNYILGACYSLHRSSIEAMLKILPHSRPTQLEDVGVSRLANELKLTKCVSAGLIKSWKEIDSHGIELAHVGQDWPRPDTPQLYKTLIKKLRPVQGV